MGQANIAFRKVIILMYLKNLNFLKTLNPKGTTHPLDSGFNKILNKTTQIVQSSSNGVIPTKWMLNPHVQRSKNMT